MENYNLSESGKNLISKLLLEGLSPNYEEVLSLFNDYNKDNLDLLFIILALDYIKEDTLLLKLKVDEWKLHTLIKILDTPTYLAIADDGLIHLDGKRIDYPFYHLSDELLHRLTIDNINYPNAGETASYFETTIGTDEQGVLFQCTREYEIDSTGKVLKLKNQTCRTIQQKLKEDILDTPKMTKIYDGILGDILNNLEEELNENK